MRNNLRGLLSPYCTRSFTGAICRKPSSLAHRTTFAPFHILLVLLFAMGCKGVPDAPPAPPPPSPAPTAVPTAVFPDGWTVKLDLATEPEEQERGLMFVEDLPGGRGMLFVYRTDEVRPFWMKNCKIPMDFIWLSADGVVVDITRDAPPCFADPCPTYQASSPSRYNLEVRGGLAAAHGLHPGDKVLLKGIPEEGMR